jgi:repressor LexA
MSEELPPLTEPQEKVLEFIYDTVSKEHIAPTRAEIAKFMGYKSPNAAHEVVQALVRKGRIKVKPRGYRGILVEM